MHVQAKERARTQQQAKERDRTRTLAKAVYRTLKIDNVYERYRTHLNEFACVLTLQSKRSAYMPVIAAFNSKGGSTKSTALLVLADSLARQNASVTVIDTDPQRSIANWREQATTSTIEVIEQTSSTGIHKAIKDASAKSAFVFVDMAGFTSDMRTPVVSRADLMIIPMQPSPEDARKAADSFALITSDEETLGRTVDKRILWSRTVPNMISRVERKIMAEIQGNDVPSFTTHLHERSAYKAMMLEGVPLAELNRDEYNGVDKAITNADLLAAELVEYIINKQEKAA